MGQITLRLPKRVRARKGRYFWQPTPAVEALGFSAEPLGADPVAAFARADKLNRQVDDERARSGEDRQVEPGTIKDLIRQFKAAAEFKLLAPRTQKDYGDSFKLIESRAGALPIAAIDRKGLKQTYRKLTRKHGLTTANRHMKAWQALTRFAYDEGYRDDNPGWRLKLTKPRPRRQVWRPDQVEAIGAAALAMKRPSVALGVRLAYDIAQRPADVLKLTWPMWDGDGFLIDQNKTGEPVRVLVSPATRQLLVEAHKVRASVQIIVSEATRRPYRYFDWAHQFAEARAAAGLPKDLQFRDLRRTALTEAGRQGATDDELRALSGHQSRDVVSVYVVPDGHMAARAQRKRWRSRKARRGNKTGAASGN